MSFVRRILKNVVQIFLEILVKIKLHRTHPKIIGITGSFGKTSTKEAIYEVLKTKWNVARSLKSLNTEIGLLLGVLEQPSGFRSPLKWLKIIVRGMVNTFIGKKYDFLILEYGADKPGDIEHLIHVVKPNISIITHIAPLHQAEGQFCSTDEVFWEKAKLVKCLRKNEVAILNAADDYLIKLNKHIEAKIFWFSEKTPRYSIQNNIEATDVKHTAGTLSVTIRMGSQKIPASFPVIGAHHINIFLPALICGLLHGISLEEGVKALQSFKLPPGRMSLIQGKNGAILLDSTYNASPETMAAALDVLRNFPGKRKIAVLGNMNELGDFSEKMHRTIGNRIGTWLDELITVGDQVIFIIDDALKNGFPATKIKTLQTAEQAGEFLLAKKIGKDDVILFKGSQNNIRLERAVKMLMAHPEEAGKVLCRQGEEWKKL